MAAEYKIPCAHFIMFGGPGENLRTVQESLDNLDKLHSSVLMAFNGIRILPRTGIYERRLTMVSLSRTRTFLHLSIIFLLKLTLNLSML